MQMSLIADVVIAVVDTAVTCLSVDVSLSVANVLFIRAPIEVGPKVVPFSTPSSSKHRLQTLSVQILIMIDER